MQHTSISVEVVGTGSDGTEPSVMFSVKKHGVYSDDEKVAQRYLFNCGEGTQRLCNENGLKLGALTSIFMTRMDPLMCSGIPGMILALGSSGNANLRVVGPADTYGFVTSTKSFARRNYPAITCVEVDTDTRTDANSHVGYTAAASNKAVVDDQFVRITPVSVKRQQKPPPPVPCRHCQVRSSSVDQTVKAKKVAVVSRGHGQDESMLEWLRSFYETHDASKVPYVLVILNKYQGRHDELKSMLFAKYGSDEGAEKYVGKESQELAVKTEDMPSNKAGENHDSSDDDSSSSDASSSSDHKEETKDDTSKPSRLSKEKDDSSSDDDDSESSMETWLRHFYQQRNPAMLPRMTTVLNTYRGREEQLKAMLEQKYAKEPPPSLEQQGMQPPPAKKAKITDDAVSLTFVSPPPLPLAAPIQHDQLVIYILEFNGTTPTLVWLVDVPDMTWLPHIQAQLTPCKTHHPSLVVHITPAHIAIHPAYVAWIGLVSSPETRHLLFDGALLDQVRDGVHAINFKASAQLRLNLHAKSTALFPLSKQFQSLQADGAVEKLVLRTTSGHFHIAQPRMTCQLTVAKTAQVLGFHYDMAKWEIPPPLPSSSTELPQPLPPLNSLPKLTFLGTGCAAPSKLRNSSGIYFEFAPPSLHGMLMDCGEGTFGQLYRQFGTSTWARIAALQLIWISHKHADHHCGLLRVLLERHRTSIQASRAATSLILIAPGAVLAYVSRWKSAWLTNVHLVTCDAFNQPDHPLRNLALSLTGFQNLWSVPVHHCHDAFGLVVISGSGIKVVYSGDTRPCDRLIRDGFRPHVLIHEATFEDSMMDDALAKNHSTVGEAMDVGVRMQAMLVLLTHFSQRYPSLPPRYVGSSISNVGFAFDGMQVVLADPLEVVGTTLNTFMHTLSS
ncbi:hypothetical protein LEN26_008584 [Aphanomyces euteiches]|nr:hypothetical protein AeMF1_001819 [Aphanomyces euteiches]KAH9130373.1 hypothetical protein LEN26_008584 [Aphanomyces euteiches]KAH9190865.1 hypothetical protein AeNC1_007159 [Aphanomyces euteiches]